MNYLQELESFVWSSSERESQELLALPDSLLVWRLRKIPS